MQRFVLSLVVAAALTGIAPTAQAQCANWMFQRSYYSHDPITRVRIAQPAVSGGPYYTRPQGAYVRAGFRNNNIIINAGRAGSDQTTVWESWVQTGQQF